MCQREDIQFDAEVYNQWGKEDKINAIVALSFGEGIVNKYLADVVKEILTIYPEPAIVCQKEVAANLDIPCMVIENKGYIDTIEVLKRARKTIKGDNIVLVTHPSHFQRSWHIATKLGFKVSEGRTQYVWDRNDPQIHCRNWLFYSLWEIPAYIKAKLIK